jgi:hypothetical protein
MKHLITKLTVPALNLTCLRESKQHHNKDMKQYVACKMRHLITNCNARFLHHKIFAKLGVH